MGTMALTTNDQIALRLLLAPMTEASRKQALKRASRGAAARVHNLCACPECGHRGPHESNGATGSELNLLCVRCGTQFEPEFSS